MRPGVDGAVEMEGEGEGACCEPRGVGGTTMKFGVSIKRGTSTPEEVNKERVERKERTGLKSGFRCRGLIDVQTDENGPPHGDRPIRRSTQQLIIRVTVNIRRISLPSAPTPLLS